jgi:hypothetical protein
MLDSDREQDIIGGSLGKGINLTSTGAWKGGRWGRDVADQLN